LLIDIGGDAQTLRLVNIIRDNVNRLDRMVRDVLELSRRDRAKRQEIDLREVIESFVREFSQIEGIDEGVLTIEILAGGKVEVDPVHFNQIIWNLVRNAWRHCTKNRGSILIRVVRRQHGLEMHVIDDGGGVPAELQAQLFEPFFTTYSSGTGLGLYIARELCAANGAALDYVDGRNGADFRVLWP
jgi:two-component system sensor histidine kinase PilS (NtrC family)